MNPKTRFAMVLTICAGLLALAGSAVLWFPAALAQETGSVIAQLDPEIWKWGLMAAAIATGGSSLGAGYAVGHVGAAAMGALAEKPELLGRLLIFIGLAEGIAIYGLIMSVLILNRLV